MPIQKWPICPISALREKFNPRNINYMHPKGTSFGRLWLNFSGALISTKFSYFWTDTDMVDSCQEIKELPANCFFSGPCLD